VVQAPLSPVPKAGSGKPETSGAEDMHSTPQQSPLAIDLRDVLHVTVLDDQLSGEQVNASDGLASETKSMRNRWERVPINAFHRLRSAVRAHGGALGSPVTMGGPSSVFDLPTVSTSTSPRPADGFSYGATTSVVSPYSEFGAFGGRRSRNTSPRQIKRGNSVSEGHSRRKFTLGNLAGEPRGGRPTERGKRKMLTPPVLLPVNDDGDGKNSKPRVPIGSRQPAASQRLIASHSDPTAPFLMSPVSLSLDT
jgi:hypothetical protein